MLLQSVPLCIVTYSILAYSPRGGIHFLIFNGLVVALGVAGLVAFAPRDAMTKTPLGTVKPPRVSGDGTSGFLDAIVWLLAIAGYFAGQSLWVHWGHSQNLPFIHGFQFWFLFISAALIESAAHESGHAAVGMALGMKLRAFIVGPFQWRIRDGQWKFQFLLAKFLASGGATAIVPTNPEQSREDEICMIAAGPLASLCTGMVALATVLTAKGSSYEQAWEFLAFLATFALVSFAVNLIPVRPEALYSDGARIYQLLRGGPLADLHRVFNIAGSTLVTPLRPKDYDIEAIKRAAANFTQGQQALLLRLFAAHHYLDCGMIPAACAALTEAETIYLESAPDIPAELHQDFVFGNAFLRRDVATARQWWERMEKKKPRHLGVDYWLAQCALFWIENRGEEAREAWNKGSVLAQKLPAAGAYEFDRYRCSLLRKALDGAPASA